MNCAQAATDSEVSFGLGVVPLEKPDAAAGAELSARTQKEKYYNTVESNEQHRHVHPRGVIGDMGVCIATNAGAGRSTVHTLRLLVTQRDMLH